MLQLTLDEETSLFLLQEQHAEEVFAVVDANRSHLRRWLPWVDVTQSADDTRAFIRTSFAQYAERSSMAFGLRLRGAIAGGVGAHRFNWPDRRTSIGYWLAENAQGQGLMTRACTALLDYLFDELALHRVEIQCATGNTRSCAVPERLGFAREGVLRGRQRLQERYVDLVMYGLLEDDWRRRKAEAVVPPV
jgi:ribosomal-protein-serine acetyltransferase